MYFPFLLSYVLAFFKYFEKKREEVQCPGGYRSVLDVGLGFVDETSGINRNGNATWYIHPLLIASVLILLLTDT